jgi:rhamnopyranosyl-N-acetylglucosaminyl-diphospho-decaprenol beta-1,3/1,4-galactofuranosyltransferase
MNYPSQVFAVVVTYNRRNLLEKCINALLMQTATLCCILVINNASTDDTHDWIQTSGLTQHPRFAYRLESENLGGAGGFAVGMQTALEMGADWVWMMDDDAEPDVYALEQLLKVATETGNVHGSLAVSGANTAWRIHLLGNSSEQVVERAKDIPAYAQVAFLPFLGFMIHRHLIDKVGLPDADFFIAADDAEYCSRIQQSGAKIIIVGTSRINHPKSDSYLVKIFWRQFLCLRLLPWKRYYDTRNRILIAKKYYGYRLWTETLPGSFIRLIATLVYEPGKMAQLYAFFVGLFDGLIGLKGRRHEFWRL